MNKKERKKKTNSKSAVTFETSQYKSVFKCTKSYAYHVTIQTIKREWERKREKSQQCETEMPKCTCLNESA